MSTPKRSAGLHWQIWCAIVRWCSGEWLLDRYANGGDVILTRAAIITVVMTLPILVAKDVADPSRVFAFAIDFRHLFHLLVDNLAVIGAIFAASYTALYARFSSQWNYLANLYNQQMQVAIASGTSIENDQEVADTYYRWCAAFVEDAWYLHLARKPMFAEVIQYQLKKTEISSHVEESLGKEEFHELTFAVDYAVGHRMNERTRAAERCSGPAPEKS